MADERVLERAVIQVRELERMTGPPGPPGEDGGAGSTDPATAAAAGIVKVNTDDPGDDPTVYRSEEVDTLLAAKATAADLTTEATARAAGDATNATAVTTEATARAAGDATNATAITTEAGTRASADASLDARLDTEEATSADHETRLDAVEATAPTSAQKAALAGTGTPSGSNKYATADTVAAKASQASLDAVEAASIAEDAALASDIAGLEATATDHETRLDQAETDLTGKQPLATNLTAFASLIGASDRAAYFTAAGTLSLYTLTAFGRTLGGLADAAAGRTALGVVIGTNVQAFHANLSALAGLTLVADRLPYANGAGTLALATLTAFGRSQLDDADAAAGRTTLGLGSLATVTPTGTPDGTKFLRDDNAWATPPGSSGSTPEVCCGRLTLESGVPISTTDQTGKTHIYWTAYKGNRVAIYNGTSWEALTFSADIDLALGTLTSGKLYDVFGYNNGGTLGLELSAAWNSDTTRFASGAYAADHPLQNGVKVKSTNGTAIDATRRYLGTFRTTSTTTTEDSGGGTTTQVGGKRFVWNYYNRVHRELAVVDTSAFWAYGTNTWRQRNGAAGNKVEYVCGVNEELVSGAFTSGVAVTANSARAAQIAVGLDSTTSPSRFISDGYTTMPSNLDIAITVMYRAMAGLGYHYLSCMEKGADGTTSTFFGSTLGSAYGLTATLNG